jgi:glycine cleavage system H protein
MADRKYSEDHEWVEVEGDTGMIGISDYAQEQLGDVVFVELPDVGKMLDRGDEAAVVESVKAAAEVYAPVGGEVIEVNDALNGDPSLVNTDAFGDGWFAKLRLTDPGELDELMDEAAYKTFCEGLS